MDFLVVSILPRFGCLGGLGKNVEGGFRVLFKINVEKEVKGRSMEGLFSFFFFFFWQSLDFCSREFELFLECCWLRECTPPCCLAVMMVSPPLAPPLCNLLALIGAMDK